MIRTLPVRRSTGKDPRSAPWRRRWPLARCPLVDDAAGARSCPTSRGERVARALVPNGTLAPAPEGGNGPPSGRSSASRGVAILPRSQADVAQLVEHHLAKVRVAGSSPVIRSGARSGNVCPCQRVSALRQLPGGVLPSASSPHGGVAEWFRQGSAKPCTPVQFRAPPPSDLREWRPRSRLRAGHPSR